MAVGFPSSKLLNRHREKPPLPCLPPATVPDQSFPVMPDATIHTLGRVLENPSAVLYRVSLPNGKTILAHLSKSLTEEKAVFSRDAQVLLELTPYDFDTARILGPASLADAEAAEDHS